MPVYGEENLVILEQKHNRRYISHAGLLGSDIIGYRWQEARVLSLVRHRGHYRLFAPTCRLLMDLQAQVTIAHVM